MSSLRVLFIYYCKRCMGLTHYTMHSTPTLQRSIDGACSANHFSCIISPGNNLLPSCMSTSIHVTILNFSRHLSIL